VLQGRSVIVTGAGRGLGRAYATAIAAAGASVVVNDIDAAAARQTAAEIGEAHAGRVTASAHDITDPDQAAAMVELCRRSFGGLDGLVNNAGLFYMAPPDEEDPARARSLLAVNVLGVLNCGLAAIPHFVAAGRGVIVNIISGAALGLPGMSTYGASKGAVLSLTRCWALDLARHGVRVCGLSPVALTRMNEGLPRRGPIAEPEAIAPLAVYLLSDAASHLNGEVVRLAGSELARLEPARFGPPLGKSSAWTAESIAEALAPGNTP